MTVSDCCTSSTIESAPSAPDPADTSPGPEPTPAIDNAPSLDPTSGSGATGKALLSVTVPEDAKVFVNGQPTTTTGEHRKYVSPSLPRGFSYSYEVRAETVRDGRPISETRMVRLQAGRSAGLTFDLSTDPAVQTVLTLNVPEGASVTLNGQVTQATGAVRRFATTRLAPGDQWKNYQVVVTVDRDGQPSTRQENITLTGGESRQLTFGFVDERIALR